MRAIDAQLPAYQAARGLSARSLAWRVYARKPTVREVALIDRAAQRLVDRDLAGSAEAAGVTVYFRAEGIEAPAHVDDPAQAGEPVIDGAVILERAVPLSAEWLVNVPHHGRNVTGD
jgi:hypothetical protein